MRYAAYPVSGLVVLSAAHLGLTQSLGAHPFWATKIAWIGVPIGLFFALALFRLKKPVRLVLFGALLVAAAAAAHFGKLEFAASYAENQLAGRFWHFGWIGAVAAATALIAAFLTRRP